MRRVLDGAIGDIVAIQETCAGPIARSRARRRMERDGVPVSATGTTSTGFRATTSRSRPDPQPRQGRLGDARRAAGQGLRAGRARDLVGAVYGDVFDHHAIVYEYANGVRMCAFGRAQNGCWPRSPTISSAPRAAAT